MKRIPFATVAQLAVFVVACAYTDALPAAASTAGHFTTLITSSAPQGGSNWFIGAPIRALPSTPTLFGDLGAGRPILWDTGVNAIRMVSIP
jgi:hypothetical protein